MPYVTHVPEKESSRGENDIAARLRKDRQAFYIKATGAARASITMDIPKPPLRPPIQPPGLFHLLVCGLLKFDLECGEFHVFQEEVENWKNDPSFMDRLFAAYGRFYSPSHQVHPLFFPNSPVLSYIHSGFAISVVTYDSLVIVDCSDHAPLIRLVFTLRNMCS
jgi:hypothetical protein